jgi:hypothetical protein
LRCDAYTTLSQAAAGGIGPEIHLEQKTTANKNPSRNKCWCE